MKYPKIESVKALSDMKLLVIFENCAQRIYDCRLLTDKEPFDQLQNESLFRMVNRIHLKSHHAFAFFAKFHANKVNNSALKKRGEICINALFCIP
jgi:hypothetical protein